MRVSAPTEVPAELAACQARHNGVRGRAWIAALPQVAEGFLDRWDLRRDGPSQHGMTALVLPVARADGTPAALKLQPVDEENIGEALGQRTWIGNGRRVVLRGLGPVLGVVLPSFAAAVRVMSSRPRDPLIRSLPRLRRGVGGERALGVARPRATSH